MRKHRRESKSFWFGRKETSMETKCGPVEACDRASVSGRCLLSGLGNQGMGDASSEKNNIGHGIVSGERCGRRFHGCYILRNELGFHSVKG